MRGIKKWWALWRQRHSVRQALSTLASLSVQDGVFTALGGLTEEESQALQRWCVRASSGHQTFELVEVGTLFGVTANELAEATPEGVHIVAVDNFCWNPFGLPPASHEAFTRRLLARHLKSGRIRLFVGSSEDYRAALTQPPNMVFLDGDHRYEAVKRELEWAKALGVEFISGHDWGNSLFGVTRAVREVLGEPDEVVGMCWFWHGIRGKRP